MIITEKDTGNIALKVWHKDGVYHVDIPDVGRAELWYSQEPESWHQVYSPKHKAWKRGQWFPAKGCYVRDNMIYCRYGMTAKIKLDGDPDALSVSGPDSDRDWGIIFLDDGYCNVDGVRKGFCVFDEGKHTRTHPTLGSLEYSVQE